MVDRSQRHPQGQGSLPEHLCPVCASVRFEREPSCADCGAPRPSEGWSRLDDSDDPLLGRTIDGRFFVSRRITRCGETTIYRASCLAVAHDFGLWTCELGQLDCDRDTLFERMKREAKVVRGLDTSHVVALHEFFELPNQRAAVLMDYVEGPCLDTLVQPGSPLDIGHACRLGAQLLDGLDHAHRAGLTHRQLHPSNLLVEQLRSGEECLRLLNFGLGGLRAGTSDDPFRSPEERRGDAPDIRSNIYSAGAVLFALLTGEAPRPRWNSGGTWGLLVEEGSVRVSEARGDSAVPDEIDGLVAGMLSRKPPARPTNLADGCALLERFAACPAELGREKKRESASVFATFEESTRPGARDLGELLRSNAHIEPRDSGKFTSLSPSSSGIHRSATRPSGRSLSHMSLTQTLEGRLPSEYLPNDVDPRSSVSFWPAPSTDNQDFGWINRPATRPPRNTPQDPTPRMPSIVAVGCSTGRLATIADADGGVWATASGQPADLEKVTTLPGELASIDRSGDRLAAGLQSGQLVYARGGSSKQSLLLETIDRAGIVGVATANEGGDLVACAASGRVYIGALDTSLGDADWARVRSKEAAVDVAIAARARIFAVMRASGAVELYGLDAPYTKTGEFEGAKGASALAISADAQLVALAARRTVFLYHPHSGQQIACFERLDHPPAAVYFDADNDLVGVCQLEGKPRLWNVATNSPVGEPTRRERR